ncbi:stage II sporulation protein AA (anti-sigma F factor antagonist) [Streptomyces sp. SLBN-118]|uniref:STAS domain-containing protein n=1 Tax=Streptomyces sp. SLBN-118 TaxID=2768454 RepID=UPI0011513562|nr:STAS domain-containing protein [Streptomyces sp. SLBN-118]TQK42900.1 stage II sporulation protein AA (anti-sigma F factor antagonist) [Streptomyces sp. SLBN-118]
MVSGFAGQPQGDGAARTGRFGVEVRPAAGAVVLVLSGELDHDTAEPLREALAEAVQAAPERIVIDCADLSFCDSTGLNLLLRARLAAREADSRLALSALRPSVARMFDITGAQAVFPVYARLDEALANERPEAGEER